MGYLIGFVFAAYFAGIFNYDKNIFKNSLKLIFSTSFIYILGIVWLGSLIGWDKPLFQLGVQPFLLAELFKILIILFLVTKIKEIRRYI